MLQLNHASMVEAMQLYVNVTFDMGTAPEVTDVKYLDENGMFTVVLTKREDPRQMRLPIQHPGETVFDNLFKELV